jgi:HK97 family phage prohead protease
MLVSPSIERRAAAEIRRDGRRLEGYAAVFNVEARVADFVETVAPGAFTASLADGRDILALVDHDARAVLARTRSGTLRLAEDSRGLAFSLDVPDTQPGRDALALAERGDLGGASFGFRIPKGGERWDGNRRTLARVELLEISVVSSFPAYAETSVSARSRDAAERARLALRVRLA